MANITKYSSASFGVHTRRKSSPNSAHNVTRKTKVEQATPSIYASSRCFHCAVSNCFTLSKTEPALHARRAPRSVYLRWAHDTRHRWRSDGRAWGVWLYAPRSTVVALVESAWRPMSASKLYCEDVSFCVMTLPLRMYSACAPPAGQLGPASQSSPSVGTNCNLPSKCERRAAASTEGYVPPNLDR